MKLFLPRLGSMSLAVAVAVAVAALVSGCASAPTQKPEDTQFRAVKLQPNNVLMAPTGGPPCLGQADADASCDIEVTFVEAQGNTPKICLVTAPEVRPTFGPNERRKKIVWRLRQVGSSEDLRFHRTEGILVVTEKVPRHIRERQFGTDQFLAYAYPVRNGSQKGNSTYVPIVLWQYLNVNNELVEDLCAAIDPKIVNVN
jgi:hypothetical protein